MIFIVTKIAGIPEIVIVQEKTFPIFLTLLQCRFHVLFIAFHFRVIRVFRGPKTSFEFCPEYFVILFPVAAVKGSLINDGRAINREPLNAYILYVHQISLLDDLFGS